MTTAKIEREYSYTTKELAKALGLKGKVTYANVSSPRSSYPDNVLIITTEIVKE